MLVSLGFFIIGFNVHLKQLQQEVGFNVASSGSLPRANTIEISPGFYLKTTHEATLHLYRSCKV